MNYIGSKYSLIKNISDLIEENILIKGKALDLFSGTSTVAQQLKLLGFDTYANDWQYYSFVTANSYLMFDDYPSFTKLMSQTNINELFENKDKSYVFPTTTIHSLTNRNKVSFTKDAFKVLWYLEDLEGKEGKFFHEYCEGGNKKRLYYSEENGKKIQAIGDKITEWNEAGLLSKNELYWLRASLVESADRVANTASVYGAFLKKIKKTAQKQLEMIALAPIQSNSERKHQAFCHDASTIFENQSLPKMTLTYVDPPYNRRQYSGNYHILETIARWDLAEFEPRGKTGLRNASEQSSIFCSKSKVYDAFDNLFSSINSEYILFSYNNEGLLSEDDLVTIFNKHCSEIQFFRLNYGRFRADNDSDKRNYTTNTVEEFLILGKKMTTNETFGISFQHAVCKRFGIKNDINFDRISETVVNEIASSNILSEIFQRIGSNPERFLTGSNEFTDKNINRCPHNFLLSNRATLSFNTFGFSNKKFAPNVVGQPGNEVINYYFGDIAGYEITRSNFKQFCYENVHEIIPILLDYALISDFSCWIYRQRDGSLGFDVFHRGDAPELTFSRDDFTFTRSLEDWNESVTVKYNNETIAEFQLHNNRAGFKLRLQRDRTRTLLREYIVNPNRPINNSMIGDSAEMAICQLFELSDGVEDKRLLTNSVPEIVHNFKNHYEQKIGVLFPISPVAYQGTQSRTRGGRSRSGVDFRLEGNLTLSVKTNKNRSKKVCPPDIGQPSPRTFDRYFGRGGVFGFDLYDGEITPDRFRKLVLVPENLVLLLGKYIEYLNECDFILWSIYIYRRQEVVSRLVSKKDLLDFVFEPEKISYSNTFQDHNSVTIKYLFNDAQLSLGEFQLHSGRSSLKFRFDFESLLRLV